MCLSIRYGIPMNMTHDFTPDTPEAHDVHEVMLLTTPQCFHCQKTSQVLILKAHFWGWQQGLYIQDAFPYLNADQREIVKSGTHPECWDAMMG